MRTVITSNLKSKIVLVACFLAIIFINESCSKNSNKKEKPDNQNKDNISNIPVVEQANNEKNVQNNNQDNNPDINTNANVTFLNNDSFKIKKSFYDSFNSKHWVFYYNGSTILYANSSDATNWTDRGELNYNTDQFDLAYKEISSTPYLFVVIKKQNDIILKRGILKSDNIQFEEEITIFSTKKEMSKKDVEEESSEEEYLNPSIAIDNSNYIWVAAIHQNLNGEIIQVKVSTTEATEEYLHFYEETVVDQHRIAGIKSINISAKDDVYVIASAGALLGYKLEGNWEKINKPKNKSFVSVLPNSTGYINAITVYQNEIVIDGYVRTSKEKNEAVNYIQSWNGQRFKKLAKVQGIVQAFAVLENDLYAGGILASVEDMVVNNIAKWDGTAWSSLGDGVNNTVFALLVSGTDLYVGGNFTSAGDIPANRIAKWDGSKWSALGSGIDGDSDYFSVYALAILGTDLYVGGNFKSAGGMPAKGIAKWDGSSWSALGSGVDGDYARVNALAVLGTDLYAGGMFRSAGDIAANYIAKWDGSRWNSLGNGTNSAVEALAVLGTDLYVGGKFEFADNIVARGIAKWDGSNWSAVAPGAQDVYAIAFYKNKIIAAGNSLWQTLSSIDIGSQNDKVSVIVDDNNNLHILYSDHYDNQLKYKYFNGTSWSDAKYISYNPVFSDYTLHIDSKNDLYATWIEGGNIKYRKFSIGATNMENIQSLDSSYKANHLISHEILSNSRIQILWSEFFSMKSKLELKSAVIELKN